MKRGLLIVGCLLLLAGCARLVDPAKIRMQYGAWIQNPPDAVWVYGDPPIEGGGTLRGEPGEKFTLSFRFANGVRDEVFVQFDETTAYLSSIVTYLPGDPTARMAPVPAPPVANPAISAAAFRRLSQTGDDARLHVELPLALPAGDWERGEVTVVFYLHGFTRETHGEFRDTITRTIAVERRRPPATRPAGVPASAPAGGRIFVRPLGTMPGT